jgi:ABC-type transporter MlaC component
MANFEENVRRLSHVRINERNQDIAFDVATDLVFEVMGRPFDKLSESQQRSLVRPYANHLHNNYQKKLHLTRYSREDAAREAMEEEVSIISKKFAPGKW